MSESLEKVSKLINQIVPTFEGHKCQKANNDLMIFLDCAKQVHDALDSAEEKLIFLSLAKTKLRGEAYDLVKYLKIDTFTDLESLLLNYFTPSTNINDAIIKMRQCIQAPHENVNDFGMKINLHLLECKRAIKAKYREGSQALIQEIDEEACYIFKTGITSPIIRQAVIAQTNKTLDELIKISIEIEKTEMRTIQNRQIGANWPTSTNISSTFNDDEVKQLRKLLSSQLHFSQKNNDEQFNYDMHMPSTSQEPRRETLSKSATYSGSQNRFSGRINSQQSNSMVPVIKCTFCNRMGHTYSDCRTRQRKYYCSVCKQYGHVPQDCRQRTRLKCEWCARVSHSTEECRAKKTWEEKNSLNNPNSGN